MMTISRASRTMTAIVFAGVVSAGVLPGPVTSFASGSTEVQRVARHRYRLAAGVTLTTIRYPRAPNEVRVLTLTQGHGPVADVLPAGPAYPSYTVPSRLAWAAGALGAVNDDFSVHGVPKHLSLIDGELWTTGVQPGGPGFGFTQDGRRAFVDVPDPLITALPAGRPAFTIDRWNAGVPRKGQIGAFSLRGGSVERPPGDDSPTASSPRWCAARLTPSGPIEWVGPKLDRLGRSYVVDAQPEPCPKTRMSRGTVGGTVVLASHATDGDASILPLHAGQTILLRWSLRGGSRTVDFIGGTPMLVHNGRNVGPGFHPGDPYIFNFNPRTAVGITKGCQDTTKDTICTVFLVTVDGRQDHWSRGMRFPDLGRLMIRLGADDAVNLDGGGSTEAWVRERRPAYCQRKTVVGGCVADRPSDGHERPAVMALALLPRADPGDPPR